MADNLNIGIIGTRGIPNAYGGFEAFTAAISPRLVRLGHKVSVYCSHDHPFRAGEIDGVQLIRQYNPESLAGTAGQFIYDLNCNLDSRNRGFDVVLHLGYTSDSAWGHIWAKGAKHITNMDGLEWKRSKYPPLVRVFLKHAESWAAKRSHHLVADSPAILSYLEQNYKAPTTYISYGTEIPRTFDPTVPGRFGVQAGGYDLMVGRMVPENNAEMAISAQRSAGGETPLLILSNQTSWGRKIVRKYGDSRFIRFLAAEYDTSILNPLRHYSRYYIHGHSAGGTNPSLLEAMACRCRILAHDNPFNRGVLGNNAGYFSEAGDLAEWLSVSPPEEKFGTWAGNNIASVRKNHDWDLITTMYEKTFYKVLA